MTPFIDRKGRPELIVNPAIKLGTATFRAATNIEPAEDPKINTPGRRRRPRAEKRTLASAATAQGVAPKTSVAPKKTSQKRGARKRVSDTAESRKQTPKREGNVSGSTSASAVAPIVPAAHRSGEGLRSD